MATASVASRSHAPLAVSAAVLLGAMYFLFGWMPYGAGWGGEVKPVFSLLGWMWKNAVEWEHCILVPFIAAFLVYWSRSRISGVPLEGSWLGAAALGFGILLYWIGYQIDVVVFSFLVMHFLFGAMLWTLFGWRFLRAVLFPYAFLFFALPMPFLESTLAFPLRDIMARFSHFFLNLIGIDAIRVGTAIVSAADHAYGIPQGAKFALDVADPCSGIRSLFALTMVSALYAWFMSSASRTLVRQRSEGPAWKRFAWECVALGTDHWRGWLVFAAAFPLAVLGNFARILMLTFGTLVFGAEIAIGSLEEPTAYHMASGFLVFGVALGGLVVWSWLLEGGWRTLGQMARRLVEDLNQPQTPSR